MTVTIAQVTPNGRPAISELKSKLGDPAAVVYFASARFDPGKLAGAVAEAFPRARTFGCTTAGELVSGAMTKGSIVAMGLGPDIVSKALVTLVPGVKSSVDGIDAAFKAWEKQLGIPMLEVDPERWVGIVLADGMSGAEERIMDRIGNLTNVIFIGGSAGDDLAFARTFVAADGKAAEGAVVLALLECPRGFDIVKTQSMHASRKFLTPTKVDKAAREVVEFDGKPAAAAYAAALGVPQAKLADQFMAHPLGLMVGGEPFVRSPQQVVGESVRFYCGVDQGVKLAVLDSTNIVDETAESLKTALARNGGAAGLLNFNCILRTLELESKGQSAAYGKVFEEIPTVGFSTYGEEYIGHINQTATMLLFK